MMTSEVIIEFEVRLGLGSTYACRIIGVSYPAYAKYRSGTRPLPLYHKRHIEAIGRLSPRELTNLINEHAHGN